MIRNAFWFKNVLKKTKMAISLKKSGLTQICSSRAFRECLALFSTIEFYFWTQSTRKFEIVLTSKIKLKLGQKFKFNHI